MNATPDAPPAGRDLRRGRGRPAVPLAGDQARALARPDPGVHGAARRPAAQLSRDPPDRHQRQDLDVADDRHAAARARPAHRPVHQPARRADDRAHLDRRRAAAGRGVRARVQRRRAVHPARRRRPGAPAVVLRDRGRHGLRRVRRRPGRRRGRRGRHGRLVGRHQRRRRRPSPCVLPIAVDHAPLPRRHARATIAVEKAGIIKPGSVAVLAEQSPEVAEVLLERIAEVGASVVREGIDFGVAARTPAVGGQMLSLQGSARTLRRRLPPALRSPPGAERRGRAGRGRVVRRRGAAARRGRRPRRVRRGHLAGPARDRPPQPHRRARRRPQPARRRGAGRRAGGLLHVQPADRGASA